MKVKGRITTWDDDRGFGFVTPLQAGKRTFVHINAFTNRARRPVVGDVVTYRVGADKDGRPCALDAVIAGGRAPTRKRKASDSSQVVGLVALLAIGLAGLLGVLPLSAAVGCVLLSVVAFVAYAVDKAAAEQGRWRTPEGTLHLLALLGGWPGALVAQARLRHKTRKVSFRRGFWVTVVVNVGVLGWLATGEGAVAWGAMLAVGRQVAGG